MGHRYFIRSINQQNYSSFNKNATYKSVQKDWGLSFSHFLVLATVWMMKLCRVSKYITTMFIKINQWVLSSIILSKKSYLVTNAVTHWIQKFSKKSRRPLCLKRVPILHQVTTSAINWSGFKSYKLVTRLNTGAKPMKLLTNNWNSTYGESLPIIHWILDGQGTKKWGGGLVFKAYFKTIFTLEAV